MNNIPTAEEVYNDFHFNYKGEGNSILEAMKHLTKLHVEAALRAADEEVKKFYDENEEDDYKPQILNAYPLTNIK